MNFDNKIPIAVIITVVLQAAGIIWWVSQQAHTVENLKVYTWLLPLTSRIGSVWSHRNTRLSTNPTNLRLLKGLSSRQNR